MNHLSDLGIPNFIDKQKETNSLYKLVLSSQPRKMNALIA